MVSTRIYLDAQFKNKLKYVEYFSAQYKQLTREESGKTGPLFYPWIVSINTALALVIVFLILLIF